MHRHAENIGYLITVPMWTKTETARDPKQCTQEGT